MIVASLAPLADAGAAAAAMLAQAVPADTVVFQQATPTGLQYWIGLLTSIASIVIAVALIAIAIPLIPAAWNSRAFYGNLKKVVERTRQDIDPLIRHAVSVADSVDYIATSVRVDVQQLNQTIAAANQRLNRAAALAEERVNDFNALLSVVQEEAEDLFVRSASTVHGVRVGADAFRRFRAEEELAEAAYADEELEEILEEEARIRDSLARRRPRAARRAEFDEMEEDEIEDDEV